MISSDFLLPKIVAKEDYWNGFFYNILLLPNFTGIRNPIAFQSWSIGVEEQFYIFWPLLVSKIKSIKRLLIAMYAIVIGIYFLRSGIYLNDIFKLNIPYVVLINNFFEASRFDNMAIGGILAIFFYKKPNLNLGLPLKLLITFLTTLIVFKKITVGFGLYNPLAAIIFAGLIYWVVKTKNNNILENKVLMYLGKISYGLYMYHIIGILLAINVVVWFNPNFDGYDFKYNLVLYSLSLLFTILISFFSYNFMEKRILKFKDRFLK